MARPRIRTLKPDIWEDDEVAPLPRETRLTFVGLITMADDDGRLRENPRAILGHVFPCDEDLTNAWLGRRLEELARALLIVRYSVRGARFIAIRSWHKHQVVNRKTPSALPAPPPARMRRKRSRAGRSRRPASVNPHGDSQDRSVSPHGDLPDASSPEVEGSEEGKKDTPQPPSQGGHHLLDLWGRIELELRPLVGAVTFETWLRDVTIVERRGDTLVLTGPPDKATWVRERYLVAIAEAASRVLGEPVEVEVAETEAEAERRLEEAGRAARRRRRFERAVADDVAPAEAEA